MLADITEWAASSFSAPKMASEERRLNDSLARSIELIALCVSMIGKLALTRTVSNAVCRLEMVSSIRGRSLRDTFRDPNGSHDVAG